MNYYFTTKNQSKIKALLILFAVICCCATSFAQWNTWCYKDFTTTGSQPFTLPANCDGIVVEAIGGGGAGGSSTLTGSSMAYHVGHPGGGGGAAYARTNTMSNNYSAKVLSIYVGAGGTCPENGEGDPTNGGDSYVVLDGDTIVKAVGGKTAPRMDGSGSYGGGTSPGANGGSSSDCIGYVKYSGGNGCDGVSLLENIADLLWNRVRGGAGGGAASGAGNGSNAIVNTSTSLLELDGSVRSTGGAAGVTAASGLISGVNWLTGAKGADGTCGSTGWESEVDGAAPGAGGAGTRTQRTSSDRSHQGSEGGAGIVRVWYHITKNDVQLAVTPENPTSCSGESVDLQAGSSNRMGSASYAWSTGTTGAGVTVNPTTNTTYTVTLTDTYTTAGTYTSACVATLSKTVTVTVASAFNAGAIASTGQTRKYNDGTNNAISSTTAATGGAGTIRYIWTENGTVLSGVNTASYTPTATEPGTYVYKRFATDDVCVADSVQSTNSWTLVIENVSITAGITGKTSFCVGDSTVLTASATVSQGTPSYKWLNTDETTAQIKVKTAGVYKVVASVTVNSITVTDTAAVTVTMDTLPTFTITTVNESCNGNDGEATVSLTEASYVWSNGSTDRTIESLSSGNYVVTVTNSNGCKSVDTAKITLNNTLDVSPVAGPTVCTGTEFTIFPEATEGTTYSWPEPTAIAGVSGIQGLSDQPSIHGVLTLDDTVNHPVSVSYTVTPKNGICTGNAMGVTVTITTTVSPGVTVTIEPSKIQCPGTDIEIPVQFVNGSGLHDVKWVVKGTTDTITHTGLTTAEDTLRVTLPTTCNAEYTYEVFYAGSSSSCIANDGCVVTVNSGTWNAPKDSVVTVPCAADADAIAVTLSDLPVAVDGCGNTINPSNLKCTRYLKSINGKYTLNYVQWSAKYISCDGVSKTWKFKINVNDVAPELTCDTNRTVGTDADAAYATLSFENPVATDACTTPTVVVSYAPATPTNATTTNASGQYPMGTTTVTYTATDNLDQAATCSFTVTVVDNKAPEIVAPADVTVHTYADVPDAYATLEEFLNAGGTASDNVKLDTNSFRYEETISTENCPKIYTRVYFIKDTSGNESKDTMQVIMDDNVKPSFTCPKDTNLCRATAGTYDASTTVTGVATELSDNNIATENLTVSYVDLDTLPADDSDLRIIRRQWTVSDECNDSIKIQNIGIFPAITAEKAGFACPADINEILPFGQCEMEINIGDATYGDFFGQTLTLTNNAPADNIYPEGTTTVTWTLTDECGFSISCDQTITVTFPECPLAVDADGNEYESVRIGCDCWTKRNLESLTYSDDTEIPGVYNYVSDVYPNEAENVANFGRLYDWASVIKDGADNEYGHVQGICPEGWYLPTAEKFAELSTYGADALKSRDYWLDGGGSNTTGFTSLPAGYYDGSIDRYMNLMGEAYYWSASKVDDEWTPAPCNIRYICNQVIGADSMSGLGYSVRCIKEKDAETAPEPVFECGTSTIEDIDGNTYNTVKIGDQCWMKENLRTSTNTAGAGNIYTPTTSGYDVNTYGRLYDWKAMMQGALYSGANPSGVQGICPTGWHVPSDAEWTQLTNYVSSQSEYQCGGSSDIIAKALASTTGWTTSIATCAVGNTPADNNATGFSAVPAGCYYASDGYSNFGNYAYFWSTTQVISNYAYNRGLYYSNASVPRSNSHLNYGYSVRCLKD